MAHQENQEFFKGRGAQVNTDNKFLKRKYVLDHIEGLDEPLLENTATQLFEETPKKIVSESNSPDLSHMYSINPYQGCEHGCIYCYARNTHEYFGFSAGLDFERKIIVKRNAAELLEQYFNKKNYKPVCMLLSGNTDCYQPIERRLKITRALLQVFLQYKNPVSIITKNNVIIRDLDIIGELAKLNLVHVQRIHNLAKRAVAPEVGAAHGNGKRQAGRNSKTIRNWGTRAGNGSAYHSRVKQ